MIDRDRLNLSNGFLPRAPLLHTAPTAVGTWDLDSSLGVWRPEPDLPGARDQLLLVRLHKQPIAIIHVDAPPGSESQATVLAAAWSIASSAILRHVERYRCLTPPSSAEELQQALLTDSGDCMCKSAARPAGAAALIICSVGRERALSRCLDSVARIRCEDFEAILVDNRPTSPTVKALFERYAPLMKVRYVSEPRPGLSRARNAGIRATDAPYLAFVDDDVVVDEGWLCRMLEPFGDESVDAVTGLVLPLNLASSVQKRFEQYAGFGKGVEPELYDMDEHRADDRFLYPYFGGVFGSGNSMAFRRDALLAIGGFDEALGVGTPAAGAEDIAAFTDVVLRGGRLAYEPRAVCWHEHRADEAALEAQVRSSGIGLTAVLWRYLWKDRRLAATILKSVPVTLGLLSKRRRHRGDAVVPVDLLRLEARVRWLGPWRYVLSRRDAKRP